ncbi:Uncharacterised protein [Yersinia frederiksenii]|nr:Uncharacterised protein [Yersinia frederiksenii]
MKEEFTDLHDFQAKQAMMHEGLNDGVLLVTGAYPKSSDGEGHLHTVGAFFATNIETGRITLFVHGSLKNLMESIEVVEIDSTFEDDLSGVLNFHGRLQ